MLKLYKNDLNYLNMFFRGETLDHFIYYVMLNPFSPWDWNVFRRFFTGECGSLPRGGGTLFFSAYVGSDPASIVNPPKISGISGTPKKYLKF